MVIKCRIGKLILNAERRHNGIAILFSMPSIRAADAHLEISVPIGTAHYPGTIKSAELAWCYLLEALGFQYQFVANKAVGQGLLRNGPFSVLMLPMSTALSEGEANAIRQFMLKRGIVFADMRAGIKDEWANVLSHGRLDDVFGITQTGLAELRAVDVSLGEGAAYCLNFSINDYRSDWHLAEPYVEIRHRPEGAHVRSFAAKGLMTAGIVPPLSFRDTAGTPLIGARPPFSNRAARLTSVLHTRQIMSSFKLAICRGFMKTRI